MSAILDQLSYIAFGFISILAFLTLVIIINLFIRKLLKYELSDQVGWKNYRKPIIGAIATTIGLLLIVLVIYVLLQIL